MKALSFLLLASSLLVASAQAAENIPNNVDDILNAGATVTHQEAFKLETGLYEINDLDSNWSTSHYMLIDNYVNDPNKLLAILFESNALSKGHSKAHFYEGIPIEDGTLIMFSPVVVTNTGRIRVQSEGATAAPVIEVLNRKGAFRYPYILRGRNGALGGRLMGMRASDRAKPSMLPWPSAGIFAATSGKDVDIMVTGNQISIYSGSLTDQTFNLTPTNGKNGKFATLTQTVRDTMSRRSTGNEDVRHLATFVSGCFDQEVFMLFTPTINYGEYNLETFSISSPSILEWIFRGRRTPNNSNFYTGE